MPRKLTPRSSLESLRREAKRWLKALRADDPEARARLLRVHPAAPPLPTLREVQHALALEHGLPGWNDLRAALARPAPGEALTELLAAANRGDAARVRELLDEHPRLVNQRGDLAGHTGLRAPLHFAVNSQSEAVLALLLERGADPDLRDDGDNAAPLHFAVEKGNLRLVRLLVEHGADLAGEGDTHELGVMGWATVFGSNPEVARYLLERGAPHNMLSAVATGAVEAIRQLAARSPAELERRMDRTNLHRRPLHLAVVKRQPAALRALLQLGADAETEDAAGLTPLDQAALNGEDEMVRLLREHAARLRLPAAVALGMAEPVERLLRDEPHALRPGGRWARVIVRAAERGDAEVIEALLRAGASVHVRDDHRTSVDGTHGYTALHAAAFHGNLAAARVLLRHGASPAERDTKYWGTPAGWADYAGHGELRDLILEGAIDIFDAIRFDRPERLRAILTEAPQLRDRRFGATVTGEPKPWLDPAWTPLAFAVAHGKAEAARLLLERGADATIPDSRGRLPAELARERGDTALAELLARARPAARGAATFEERVARFLAAACLDWRTGGSQRVIREVDAGRLLAGEPALARGGIHAAAACGELEEVARILAERPEAASALGGPHGWPPLLYLCSARLPDPAFARHSVAIARLLLEHGADAAAFYPGGNPDIHYTAFTCVMGRGEEQAPTHPRARELVSVLLEAGADPHDNQVLYNVFGGHASRRRLDDDIVWMLELMREHSLRRGHGSSWDDPDWPMFAMRGAPSLGDEAIHLNGSHFLLGAAVARNLLGLAEWMLRHGAGPTDPGLHRLALERGYHAMADLLLRYGASPHPAVEDAALVLARACVARDTTAVERILRDAPGLRADHRALFALVERDDAEGAALLLDRGVSPDVADPRDGGRRALHLAAYLGAPACAALLIARGAQVDPVETTYHSTPLEVASWAQQPGMVELLGRYSRDVWHLTYTGRTARLREVLDEDPSRARVGSVEYGTPLHWLPADADAALAITRLLLEHGADPSARDGRGRDAAQLAAERGLDEVVALLRSQEGRSVR